MQLQKILKNNITNYLVYLATFILPFQFYFRIWRDKHITLFLVIIFLIFIFQIKKFVNKFYKDKILLLYLVFFLVFSLGFFRSENKIDAVKHIFFFFIAIPIYWVYKSTTNRNFVIKILLFSSTIFVVLIIGMYFFKEYMFNLKIMKLFIEPNSLETILKGMPMYNVAEKYRSGGLFFNANVAALNIGIYLGIIIYMFFVERHKIFWLLIFFLFIFGLILTGSLSGLLSFYISSTLIVFFFLIKNKKYIFLTIILLFLFIFFFSYKFICKVNPRYENLSKIKTFGGRMEIWAVSLEVIKDNWLFGVGLDTDSWNKYFNKFAKIKGYYVKNMPPHNMFLFILGKSGIFCLLCFIIFILYTFIVNLKKFFYSRDIFYLCIINMIIWLMLIGMTENLLLMDVRISSIFWLLLGVSQVCEIKTISKN